MATFNDLPVELILNIIPEVILHNKFKLVLGQNAAWTSLDAYNDSLMYIDSENIDESDPLPPSPISIHADLLSLRLTSSTLNILCTPFLFSDLNIVKDIGMPFDDFHDLIIKPHAHHFRTARILISEPSLSDLNVARILKASKNLTSLMLYHANFQRPFMSTSWKFPEESEEQVKAMNQTNHAIVTSMATGSLTSIGIYSHDLISDKYWRRHRMPSEALISLSAMISENVDASASLKKLEIVLPSMPEILYDTIRAKFNSLNSLTINYAFRAHLPRFWEPNQIEKWSPNTNLTQLKLRRCANAYAPHIAHIVRHFVSLRVLLVAVCGSVDDPIIEKPPKGWHSASTALWKVRKPLDIFYLEHMDYWEIGVMGEIPTKTLSVANLAGSHLMRAFHDDLDYFPKLQTIMIEPRGQKVGRGTKQFSQRNFEKLQETCDKRLVTIVEGAIPTSRNPNHYWMENES